MNDKTWSACLLVLIGSIAVMILSIPLHGWVLTKLWGWFVVPVFDLPALTIGEAIGLSCVIGFLSNKGLPKKDDDGDPMERLVVSLSMMFVGPLLSLSIGWLIHQWIT